MGIKKPVRSYETKETVGLKDKIGIRRIMDVPTSIHKGRFRPAQIPVVA